jgi:hypothetical protein
VFGRISAGMSVIQKMGLVRTTEQDRCVRACVCACVYMYVCAYVLCVMGAGMGVPHDC